MSVPHRPGVFVNGVRRMRTFHYYWCRFCQRTVRIASANLYEPLCPFCYSELGEELDIPRPPLLVANPGRQPGLFPSARRGAEFGGVRRALWGVETDEQPFLRSWITLEFDGQLSFPGLPQPLENPAPRNNPRGTNNEDSLADLIEQLTQNDRPGPPPATRSVIESLPTITLTENHLSTDPCCSVCKEEFKVGGEAREMPCKHFYHSDCIVPWLHIHNTCPICRFMLQDSSNDTQGDDNGGFGVGEEEARDAPNRWWTHLLNMWPFDAPLEWIFRYRSFHYSRTGSSQAANIRNLHSFKDPTKHKLHIRVKHG